MAVNLHMIILDIVHLDMVHMIMVDKLIQDIVDIALMHTKLIKLMIEILKVLKMKEEKD
jgi:hypothetical protein